MCRGIDAMITLYGLDHNFLLEDSVCFNIECLVNANRMSTLSRTLTYINSLINCNIVNLIRYCRQMLRNRQKCDGRIGLHG